MSKIGITIFGAGGHGRVVLDILLEAGQRVLGFIDDDPSKTGQLVDGHPILGGWSYLGGRKGIKIALGIGNNAIRASIYQRAKKMGLEVANAIHPRAAVSRNARLKEGIVIMAGAVVNPGVLIEDGVCVNTGATVDHDCQLGSFCQIWPGAHLAGAVRVGKLTYVGTGASVIPGITIGAETLIGAGAAVVANIPERVVAVGVPAKPIKARG